MQKIVHAYDRETGLHVGPVTLDASDLSPLEPDVWHIPGNCTEVEPPESLDGFALIFDGKAWSHVPIISAPKQEPEPVAMSAEVPEDRRAALERAIRAEMDAQARAHGYDDLVTAISYADEIAVPQFGAEGRAFRAWRSKVWAYFYGLGDNLPDFESLRAGLPALAVAEQQQWADAMKIANDAQAAAAPTARTRKKKD